MVILNILNVLDVYLILSIVLHVGAFEYCVNSNVSADLDNNSSEYQQSITQLS